MRYNERATNKISQKTHFVFYNQSDNAEGLFMITENQYKILVACKNNPQDPQKFNKADLTYLGNHNQPLIKCESYNGKNCYITTYPAGHAAIEEYEAHKKLTKRNTILFVIGIATLVLSFLSLIATILFGILG